jgi:hypothetical protein
VQLDGRGVSVFNQVVVICVEQCLVVEVEAIPIVSMQLGQVLIFQRVLLKLLPVRFVSR